MCCLFGIIDYGRNFSGRQKAGMLSVLASECDARGTDATGIAYNSGGRLHIYKRPLAAHKLRFYIPNNAHVIMGHTRMTTQGSQKKNYNNHPFPGSVGGTLFALAHNGVIHNDHFLRRDLKLPRTTVETDSYIAVQLIEQKRALTFDSLRYMAEQVEGTFTFTVLDHREQIHFVKGDNPLCLMRFPRTGLYLYASTEEILSRAIKKLRIPLEKPVRVEASCGDMLKIDAAGRITTSKFDASNLLFNNWPFSRCSYDLLPWRKTSNRSAEQEYLDDLKSVAGAFGYCPEEIDRLIAEGISPEEIEEYLYCGEL